MAPGKTRLLINSKRKVLFSSFSFFFERMNENTVRSQAAVDYLILLGAILVIVAGIVITIYAISEGLGARVEEELENTVVENLLRGLIFG
jgi:hypothetical protein